jgi:2-deoxy-D-gluconate 3-dehydrogenase
MTTHALFDLSGRVAIVTGGNGGIGRGIALGFAQAGAAVAIFGRNEDKNAKVLAELNEAGAHATAVNVDLTDRASLEPAVRHVEAELGPAAGTTTEPALSARGSMGEGPLRRDR